MTHGHRTVCPADKRDLIPACHHEERVVLFLTIFDPALLDGVMDLVDRVTPQPLVVEELLCAELVPAVTALIDLLEVVEDQILLDRRERSVGSQLEVEAGVTSLDAAILQLGPELVGARSGVVRVEVGVGDALLGAPGGSLGLGRVGVLVQDALADRDQQEQQQECDDPSCGPTGVGPIVDDRTGDGVLDGTCHLHYLLCTGAARVTTFFRWVNVT